MIMIVFGFVFQITVSSINMLEVSSAAKIVFPPPLISVCANFGENKGLGFCEHGILCLLFMKLVLMSLQRFTSR